MDLRVICSRHPEECLAVLEEIGYEKSGITVCGDRVEIECAPQEHILIELSVGVPELVDDAGCFLISGLIGRRIGGPGNCVVDRAVHLAPLLHSLKRIRISGIVR